MAAGVHGNGGRAAESNFRLEWTGFAGRSPGALCDSGTPVVRLEHEFGSDSEPGQHVN